MSTKSLHSAARSQVARCLGNVVHLDTFSAREDNFHMTLEVKHQAAALYHLMVMLGLDGNLVTGCPYTMGPTLDTKFVSWLVPLPLMGDGSCSGPMVGVDREL